VYFNIDPNGFRNEYDEKLRISRRFIIDLSADMTESLQIETHRILPEKKNSLIIE